MSRAEPAFAEPTSRPEDLSPNASSRPETASAASGPPAPSAERHEAPGWSGAPGWTGAAGWPRAAGWPGAPATGWPGAPGWPSPLVAYGSGWHGAPGPSSPPPPSPQPWGWPAGPVHGAGECGTGAHGAGAYGAGGAPFDARGAWSPRSYFAIAFLASFFPAAVLYELNWIRLGRRRNAALRILGWSVAAGLMVASAVCLPDQARYLFWAINMGAAAFFVHRQAPAFDAYRRQGRPEAKLRHAGWPLAASLVGMLVLVCAAGFGYAAHVDRHFEAGLAAMDRAEATGQDRADYRDAQRHFETYIELVPDDPGAHHNLAVIFAELGDFERARDQIRRVRKLEPDYVALEELDEHVFVAEHNHAVDLIDGGDYEEAEALLRACHQARPDHVLSVDNLMVALLAQDRFDEARETGETFLATHPEAEPIRDRLERMDVDAAAIPNDRAGTTSL